jgi:hypothetical protein
MKKILAHIHAKPAHERRKIAMRIASALMLVAWIASLGARLAGY